MMDTGTKAMLKLDLICVDGEIQARQQLDMLAIDEYAQAMRAGDVFPPVVVFYSLNENTYWLADGFHRVRAAEAAGVDALPVDIRQGGKREAILYSVGANASHGVRRTNRDKRKAVEMLLNDEEWRQWSDREIARKCGVSNRFVTTLRDELSVNDSQIPTTRKVTRNGITYTIDTTNIGTAPSEREMAHCDICSNLYTADFSECPYCHKERHGLDGWVDRDLLPPPQPTYPLAAANHAPSLDPDYDGDEWYTPQEYIEAARTVLGTIDLDPASCHEAQEIIRASHFYTKEDDSLQDVFEWEGRMWLNPPYSMPLIKQFVTKAIDQYECGNVVEGIILTNNSSDTSWFHELLSRFPVCFTRGRVQFWRPNQEVFGARQGQAIFYLGNEVERFTNEFSRFGQVVKKYDYP